MTLAVPATGAAPPDVASADAAAGALLVFWDYDTQWGADRSRNPASRRDWGHLDFEHSERLLELHAEFGIPACFAVVGAAALPGVRPYHDPAQIRRLHAAGHEIASHAFRHEWLPALHGAALTETLVRSRDALEQCIGAPVTTFVPPFNQPFDHLRGGSISLAERRAVPRGRTDLARLCQALAGAGYRCCRVSYRPLHVRAAEWLTRRRRDRPMRPLRIGGVTALRLNTPGGFDAPALAMLERVAAEGGLVVAYGHPHSLHTGNSQDERFLTPFLRRARELARAGALRLARPRDLVAAAGRIAADAG
ncbi:MAG TPA: polysaccharide deacetylase family protein [Gemmatimonadaceae bacterium]|nr:polysaccharide deacetylase family protein [Gemmatimonadaceae bacterium]